MLLVRPLPVLRRAPRGREDACGGGVHARCTARAHPCRFLRWTACEGRRPVPCVKGTSPGAQARSLRPAACVAERSC